MEPDPLREIRAIRRQISQECDDNPDKVFDFYLAHQEKMKATGKSRFVSKPLATVTPGSATEQNVAGERRDAV